MTDQNEQEKSAEASGSRQQPVVSGLEVIKTMTIDWIRNVKTNPPPEGELVEVTGTDAYGEWVAKAYRKDYKPGSTKKQLRRKWRWMQDGEVFDDVVEAWRPIAH